MPAANLAAAQTQANNRHALSASVAGLQSGQALKLAKLASVLHLYDNLDSQSVTAIGYDSALPGKLLVSRNGALTNKGLDDRVAHAFRRSGVDFGDILPSGDTTTFEWQAVSQNVKLETQAWHAEMIIIARLLDGGRTKASLSTLTIGASSVCCPDCSGYMTRYSIHHAPFGHPGATASAPWRNPSNGTSFGYQGGAVSYYRSLSGGDSLGKN